MSDSLSHNNLIQLTNDEVLVLFDFFARFCDKDELAIRHPAEETVLLRVSAQLDKMTSVMFQPDYAAQLSAARERIANG